MSISTESDGVKVIVGSLYGLKTQQGLVELTVGNQRVQMEVRKAREVIGMLLEATEAAIGDELIVKFLTEKVGLDQQRAAMALMEFREMRQGTRGTLWPT